MTIQFVRVGQVTINIAQIVKIEWIDNDVAIAITMTVGPSVRVSAKEGVRLRAVLEAMTSEFSQPQPLET